jgi:aspartyl-tRNA(Asn)/glutamyl-tRNA(Gln) amidotransferase subunit A
MTPLAWSLDHAGPLARTVEDVALVLQALAGHDPADPTSAAVPVPDYAAALRRPVRGLRVGVPRAFCAALVDPEVGRAFDEALATFAAEGATVEDVTVPTLEHTGAMLGATLLAEAASGLGPLLASRGEGLSVEVRIYLELGKVVTARHLLAAQRLRTRLYDELSAVLEASTCWRRPRPCCPRRVSASSPCVSPAPRSASSRRSAARRGRST